LHVEQDRYSSHYIEGTQIAATFSSTSTKWERQLGYSAGVYGTLGQPGAGNVPGGRYSVAGQWIDHSGNLWLFGGVGFDSTGAYLGLLNDLWMYNPSTNQWTWMSGSNTIPCYACAQPGMYGTLGTAAITNVPGGRYSSGIMIDSKGNFWLFGGFGADANGNLFDNNDLWRYQH